MERFAHIPDPRSLWEVVLEKIEDGKIEMTFYSFGVEKMRKVYRSWRSANIAKAYYIRHFSKFQLNGGGKNE